MLSPVELAAQGYRLVPWLNRAAHTRMPLIAGWQYGTGPNPSPETVAGWMTKWPDADWAIVPVDTVVIDCDVKNGKDGVTWFRNRCRDEGYILDTCAIAETFSKGKHYWFRLPDGVALNGQVTLADGVEVKCRNSSAHVPPSSGYTWIRELRDCSQLPTMPEWLLHLWQVSKTSGGGGHDYTAITYANGSRRTMLCSMAGALRNLSLSAPELTAALKAIRDTRCEVGTEPFTDKEVEEIARDFAKKEATDFTGLVLAGDPTARSVAQFVGGVGEITAEDQDIGEEGEVEANAEVESKPVDGLCLPDHLLYPTPLIEEWVRYADDTNPRRQPELALMGCLTGLGAIMGRRWTWERSKGNLYCLGLGGSGQGKDRTYEVIPEIFNAAGYADTMGAAELGSDSGMIEELALKPEVLWVFDEMSKMIQSLNMPSCPKYYKDVEKLLTILYSGNTYQGKKLKGQEVKPLENPYPCVYGLTQPRVFWRNYNVGMTDSGFLGRFVIFNGRPHPKIDTAAAKRQKLPPANLIKQLVAAKTVYHEELSRLQNLTGGLEEVGGTDAMHDYSDMIVHKCDDIAQTAFNGGDQVMGTLYSRNTEKVKRLALIHCYSLNPAAPVMTPKSMDWAFDVLDYANKCLLAGLRVAVTPSPQTDHVERISGLIRSHQTKGIQAAELIKMTSNIRKSERAAILDDLIESGTVKKMIKKGKVGRPSQTYFANEFAPYETPV